MNRATATKSPNQMNTRLNFMSACPNDDRPEVPPSTKDWSTGQNRKPQQHPKHTQAHTWIHLQPSPWMNDRLSGQSCLHERECVCVHVWVKGLTGGSSWPVMGLPIACEWYWKELWLAGPTLKHTAGWRGQLGWLQQAKTRNTSFFCFMQQTTQAQFFFLSYFNFG